MSEKRRGLDEKKQRLVKPGEVWQLGRHRLMCGDCTSIAQVRMLFDGEQPFCIVTDPPYCSGGFQESGRSAGSIGTDTGFTDAVPGDIVSTRGYVRLMKRMLTVAGDFKDAYIFTDWRMWVPLFDCVESCGAGIRAMIVWDKQSVGLGQGWRMQHELCMFARRTRHKFNLKKGIGNIIPCKRTRNRFHPTEKPVELLVKILEVEDFAPTIYDPFAGSGSTLLACELTGRMGYAMELVPHYCEAAIGRWEILTGQKAIKLYGVFDDGE